MITLRTAPPSLRRSAGQILAWCSLLRLRFAGPASVGGRARPRSGGRPLPHLNPSRAGASQQGQTLVEFSMVVSFLFLILFGIVDFSRLFFAYATMANGVREGARYAVVHPDADDTSAVEAHAHAMMVLLGGDATVTVSYPDTVNHAVCMRRPCRVVVTATSSFNVWTPVIPNVSIVTQSTMHIE